MLGAILALAAASSTVHQGAYLLLAYSAGLAVPFLIAGFAIGSVTAGLKRFGPYLPVLELTAGAIVVLIGVLGIPERVHVAEPVLQPDPGAELGLALATARRRA